jgi:hypothetical protein
VPPSDRTTVSATLSASRPASTKSTVSPALPAFAGGDALPEGVRPDSGGRHGVGGVGVVGTDRLANDSAPSVLDRRRGLKPRAPNGELAPGRPRDRPVGRLVGYTPAGPAAGNPVSGRRAVRFL